MCSTMLYHPFGFTLANGQVFTSASFVSVSFLKSMYMKKKIFH